jgi:hypothetical protein
MYIDYWLSNSIGIIPYSLVYHRYRIDSVPPGAYNVIAWHEGLFSEPRPVVVPAGGTSELDFVLR